MIGFIDISLTVACNHNQLQLLTISRSIVAALRLSSLVVFLLP
jgi:hypothetical protein